MSSGQLKLLADLSCPCHSTFIPLPIPTALADSAGREVATRDTLTTESELQPTKPFAADGTLAPDCTANDAASAGNARPPAEAGKTHTIADLLRPRVPALLYTGCPVLPETRERQSLAPKVPPHSDDDDRLFDDILPPKQSMPGDLLPGGCLHHSPKLHTGPASSADTKSRSKPNAVDPCASTNSDTAAHPPSQSVNSATQPSGVRKDGVGMMNTIGDPGTGLEPCAVSMNGGTGKRRRVVIDSDATGTQSTAPSRKLKRKKKRRASVTAKRRDATEETGNTKHANGANSNMETEKGNQNETPDEMPQEAIETNKPQQEFAVEVGGVQRLDALRRQFVEKDDEINRLRQQLQKLQQLLAHETIMLSEHKKAHEDCGATPAPAAAATPAAAADCGAAVPTVGQMEQVNAVRQIWEGVPSYPCFHSSDDPLSYRYFIHLSTPLSSMRACMLAR